MAQAGFDSGLFLPSGQEWPGYPADPDPGRWPVAWLLLAGGGVMPSQENLVSLAAAHEILAAYRGPCRMDGRRLTVSADVLCVVRSIVADSLHAAPQPVTSAWVAYSLAVVGGLVAKVDSRAGNLDRADLLSERTLARYLHEDRADLTKHSRSSYRARLDIIAEALFTSPAERLLTRVPLSGFADTVVYSRQDEDDLVAWSAGLRTALQRRRLAGVLALGLGCGARRQDVVKVLGTSVTRDDDGVHLTITSGDRPRTVTCLARYEEMLWEAAQAAGGNPIVAPLRRAATEKHVKNAFTVAYSQRAPMPVTLVRLRNTWLLRHLEAGTPLPVLMAASGLRTTSPLVDLLPHVAKPDATAARRHLRGAST